MGARSDGITERIGPFGHDELDLEAFFVAHYRRLVGLAGLICGDVTLAEDVVQSAIERAWRARSQLVDAERLQPWLDRIVVREAARERRSRLTWLSRLVRQPGVAEIAPAGHELVDRSAGRFPADAELRLAFAALSSPQRAVVVLHLHAGYTVEETARILGIPHETVRSRLRVARDHLRRALEEGNR